MPLTMGRLKDTGMESSLCGWCGQLVADMEACAYRGDGVIWHAECFVKFLAYKDETQGIVR